MHVCPRCDRDCHCSGVAEGERSTFAKCNHQCPEFANGWSEVTGVQRELRIIRGEPIEFAEHAIAMFEDLRAYHEAGGNAAAAGVAQMAINKFRELL